MSSKFVGILVMSFVLLAALTQAEPTRYSTSRFKGDLRTNFRFLARQEAAATTAAPATGPAPYPAAGITPETPFELPTETETAPAIEPEQTYGPPEQTYGPPDQTYGPPDQTYGPPEAIEPNNLYGPPENGQPPVEEPAAQNIIQPRSQGLRLSAIPVPQQFAPRAGLVEIIRSEPILIYTLKK